MIIPVCKILDRYIIFKIITVLSFNVLIFACTQNNNHLTKTGFSTDFKFEVDNFQNGIILTFENIPPDISIMHIKFENWGEIKSRSNIHDMKSEAYAIIDGNNLENVKESNRLHFPFVYPGEKYEIYITIFEEGKQHTNDSQPVVIIAENGIYLMNEIELIVNEVNANVQVNSAPVFSSQVEFHTLAFQYVFTLYDPSSTYGTTFSYSMNGLFWDFETYFNELITESEHIIEYERNLISGDYSAYHKLSGIIIYDGLTWVVNLAKSPIFTYSF